MPFLRIVKKRNNRVCTFLSGTRRRLGHIFKEAKINFSTSISHLDDGYLAYMSLLFLLYKWQTLLINPRAFSWWTDTFRILNTMIQALIMHSFESQKRVIWPNSTICVKNTSQGIRRWKSSEESLQINKSNELTVQLS